MALGHVFSNAVRTIPAIAADVLARDLMLSAETLGLLTGLFPAAFAAAMLPVGVALDRWGVKPTALFLLAIGTGGALIAAIAADAMTMALAQIVLGIGCSGMLMCPITFAAKMLPPPRFGLWTGAIQAIGNTGMLLSASPLALLVDYAGWRAGYVACAGFAAATAAVIAVVVSKEPPPARTPSRLGEDVSDVAALAVAPALRAPMVIAFASFAAILGVRGLWGGPWLMEVKGLSRLAAGNVLLLCTLALIIGPAIGGLLERRFPAYRRGLLAGGHLGAAAAIALIVLGGALAWSAMADAILLVAFGLLISLQVVCFALVRAAVPPERVGRALSAMNLSFFAGAAVLQAVAGPVAAAAGSGGALLLFAAALVIASLLFLLLSRPR